MSLSQTDAAKDIFRQKDQLHGVVVAAVAAVVFVTVVVVVVVVGGGWLVVGGRWSVVGGRWRVGGGMVGDGGGWWAVGGGCGVVAVAVRRKTGGWVDLIKETPGAPPPPKSFFYPTSNKNSVSGQKDSQGSKICFFINTGSLRPAWVAWVSEEVEPHAGQQTLFLLPDCQQPRFCWRGHGLGFRRISMRWKA